MIPTCETSEYLRKFSGEMEIYMVFSWLWLIKSRRLRWAGHVARMEEGRSAFKVLTGKPTGK